MARILGIEIPNKKKVEYSLRYLYGIGPTRAKYIVDTLGIPSEMRAHQLDEEWTNKILQLIVKNNYKVEGDLRRDEASNLKRLQAIRCYRGIRHQKGLPVRGQRTKTNARTRKGGRRTVGVMKKS